MSDSTKDHRQHVRRGSLLDHAGDAHAAPAPPRAQAPEAVGASGQARIPGAAARRPAPSMLAAQPRTARLSTAAYAASRNAPSPADAAASAQLRPDSAPAAQPASAQIPSTQAPSAQTPSTRERFGDRIARLIGTVPAQDRPAADSSAADAPLRDNAARSGPQAEQPAARRSADAPAQDTPPPREFAARDPAPRAPARRPDQGHDDHYHWHAAAGGMDDGARPLLDASILMSAVFRYRKQIAAAAVAGALLGVLFALSTPHRYYAESRLFIDPREVRVTEDDIRNQQLSTEAMLAITDSQLQILSSTSVLEKVITDLGLERDPEFNGSLPTGGLSGGLTLIKEIFTGEGGPSEAEQKALEKLRDSLSVARDAKTFVIIVGVSSRDAEKSALIANQIVETYLDSEGRAQSSLLERTSESIDTRINALRSDLDAAEREVEKFKAENGLVGVGGQYIDDKVILALSDQLANARAMKVGIRVKANNLANVNIDDVLSGAFPEELLSTNLTELRKQYTETKSRADSLATGLGPRHPQYIAAKSALDTIRTEISAELRRIVASSQTELQRAVETEQELASQMAVAKSRAMDQSVEFVTLRELERKAAATRGIYEAFLTRSRETSERSNFTTR
ncbi:GumC family protein, partial [Hoeflea sp. BAL378]|uniref:GumC family protein n=1 Tax=Hoeflea sp. BAL378 TaxID=1547437 RepID=UPI00137713E7